MPAYQQQKSFLKNKKFWNTMFGALKNAFYNHLT